MKITKFLLGAVILLLSSCSNEFEITQNELLSGDRIPLSVNVSANPATKVLVDGISLPEGSKIGVKLIKSDGTAYDNLTYNNIYYSTTDGAIWSIDNTKSIMLSSTIGKAYAYYPYVKNDNLDFTAIPIESASDPANQVDYMFGVPATGLSNKKPVADFTMKHAMAKVNYTIARGTYTGTGAITSIKMRGYNASNEGTMNAVEGTVTATKAGSVFTNNNSLTLGSASGTFIVVPSEMKSSMDFEIVMDGEIFSASVPEVSLSSGQIYGFTLTMNSKELTAGSVNVTKWSNGVIYDPKDAVMPPEAIADSWEGLPNGLYVVRPDWKPADKLEGNSACIGVAYVNNNLNQRFMISKLEASHPLYKLVTAGKNSTAGFSWGPANIDQPDIDNLESFGADYKGLEWTNVLVNLDIDANSSYASMGALAKAFREYGELDKNTWYIPAFSQMNILIGNMPGINTVLDKIGGEKLTVGQSYWCSSENSDAQTYWLRCESSGSSMRSTTSKSTNLRVRLIVDL